MKNLWNMIGVLRHTQTQPVSFEFTEGAQCTLWFLSKI